MHWQRHCYHTTLRKWSSLEPPIWHDAPSVSLLHPSGTAPYTCGYYYWPTRHRDVKGNVNQIMSFNRWSGRSVNCNIIHIAFSSSMWVQGTLCQNRMNLFAYTSCDKSTMQPFVKLLWTLVLHVRMASVGRYC